ncbi:hypothetical protein DCCM_2062 [Desulfocucumis palustris]|uniref:Uncharacterized protein n=1 Tax=Desulfocucumis palustris TaxID=1898651 RepID=A0A2L2X9U3_9FIRM|nr:hypothetical protein DCCM_2062 [Desulfocucumis palustris]
MRHAIQRGNNWRNVFDQHVLQRIKEKTGHVFQDRYKAIQLHK